MRTWTDEQLKKAAVKNLSMAATLKQIGLSPTGANYKCIRSHIKRLGISTDHWKGQGHLKGKRCKWAKKRPLQEILVRNSTYLNSSSLKKRLLKEGALQYHCSECGIAEWNGCRLSLHLDHINGDNTDNRIENLRLLCPNCHSLTDTYAGKNMSSLRGFGEHKCACGKKIDRRYRRCKDCYNRGRASNGSDGMCRCGREITKGAKLCSTCHLKTVNSLPKKTKINWPNKKELISMVSDLGYCGTACKLGVSDNAVRKHLK